MDFRASPVCSNAAPTHLGSAGGVDAMGYGWGSHQRTWTMWGMTPCASLSAGDTRGSTSGPSRDVGPALMPTGLGPDTCCASPTRPPPPRLFPVHFSSMDSLPCSVLVYFLCPHSSYARFHSPTIPCLVPTYVLCFVIDAHFPHLSGCVV